MTLERRENWMLCSTRLQSLSEKRGIQFSLQWIFRSENLLRKLVGAWGFEPQTSAVSRQRSTN